MLCLKNEVQNQQKQYECSFSGQISLILQKNESAPKVRYAHLA